MVPRSAGVEVLGVEAEGFADAEAAPVEDGEEGPVADPGGGPGGAGPEDEGLDLGGGEDLGREGPALPGSVAASCFGMVGPRPPGPVTPDRGVR